MARGKDQQAGIDYEKRMAKVIGARIQPGSGNQWFAKLDLSGRSVLWSLKHTGKDFFRITKAILSEAIHAANDEGSIPGWMIDIAGEDFVLMRGNDFRMLMEEETKIIAEDKGAAKRRRAGTSSLRRGIEEE